VRRLYSWIIACAAPFAFAIVLWRGLRDRSYWQGLAERFGWGAGPAGVPSIWLHAVSLGEISAAAPLIRGILMRHPQLPLVVTSATPAGRARAQMLFGSSVDIRFLPYDTSGAVRRFLTRVNPRLAIIMETEIWPNLFAQCAARGVPVILANARLSSKSVLRYRRLGKLFSGVFTGNVVIAAQSFDDAERFKSIGAAAAQVQVLGNVKFDLQLPAPLVAQGRAVRAGYEERPVWIAGSTHAGEEEQVLAAHALLQALKPNALLLLVPRHKDRFAAVADLLARRGVPFTRHSLGNPASLGGAAVVLVDTVGELNLLYAAADVAFVGGSLVPIGGHNLLEPAALGLPVLTGPSYFNSKEIARLLLQRGAAIEVADAEELASALRILFDDPAQRARMGAIGRELVEQNRGSVDRLLDLMEQWLREPAAAHPSTTR
jgi:3-deoxy-D-manno-octulosonic-acid transferase